jgi:hypothetical protein
VRPGENRLWRPTREFTREAKETPMTTWAHDELDKIGAAEELEIAPRRGDGTLRKPVTIWVVRVGDGLYVRSWRGPAGAWFRGIQARHEGRIRADGLEKEVAFIEESDAGINRQIDAHTARSTAGIAPNTWTPWSPRRPGPRRSNSCRGQSQRDRNWTHRQLGRRFPAACVQRPGVCLGILPGT